MITDIDFWARYGQKLNEQQKEYYLRERLRVIEEELGEVSSKDDEIRNLKKKASKLKCPTKITKRIHDEIARFETTPQASPELAVIREYLDWMLNLPWKKYTKDEASIKKVKEIMQEVVPTYHEPTLGGTNEKNHCCFPRFAFFVFL